MTDREGLPRATPASEAARSVRFSVLLPTRNGGPYLFSCLRSILSQEDASFEVVVSDNANDDETAEVLSAFAGDQRLVAIRQETLLSVTDNWQATLDASSGDYVLMIGDDDLLLPGTLRTMNELLADVGDPDCLSFDAFRYVAPAAVADRPTSYYGSPYFGYEQSFLTAGGLDAVTRRGIVRDAYRFRFVFPLTMQLTIVRRDALARLPMGPFRSVFPDHYAICGLLLTAGSWHVTDRQLLVIGVSPKSFGHFFLNDEDEAGLRYLGLQTTFPGRLPGNQVLNAQCDWLAETKRDFAPDLADTDIDRSAYVARQVRHWLRQYRHGTIDARALLKRFGTLSWRDVADTTRAHVDPDGLRAVARSTMGLGKGRTVYLDRELQPLPGVGDIAGFATWLEQRALTPSHWVAEAETEAV